MLPPLPKPIPKKRPKGSGSVRVVERGDCWVWRASFPTGRRGRSINAGTYADEGVAHARLDALCEAHSEGLVPASELTVAQWVEGCIDSRAQDGYHANARSERGYARHIFEMDIGAIPLDAVTARDVRTWAAALKHRRKRSAKRKAGSYVSRDLVATISHQSQVHALNVLRSSLGAAVVDERIPANPAFGVKIKKPRVVVAKELESRIEYLTEAQINQLLGCSKIRPQAISALAVAIYTGLREGEITGLQWGDVEGLGDPQGWITVRRSWEGDPPKTGKARRIPILPRLVPYLRTHHAHSKLVAAADWVFPSQRRGASGSYQFARGYDWGWADHKDARHSVRPGLPKIAGISTTIPLRDLRDTCATHLISGSWSVDGRGWPIELVSRMLGHSDPKITAQRYAHITSDALAAAAAKTLPYPVGGDFGSAGGAPEKLRRKPRKRS